MDYGLSSQRRKKEATSLSIELGSEPEREDGHRTTLSQNHCLSRCSRTSFAASFSSCAWALLLMGGLIPALGLSPRLEQGKASVILPLSHPNTDAT